MLIDAARTHGIDLGSSFMVGDRLSDLEAGKNVGATAILVLTGYGTETVAISKPVELPADHIADNLLGAMQFVKKSLRRQNL